MLMFRPLIGLDLQHTEEVLVSLGVHTFGRLSAAEDVWVASSVGRPRERVLIAPMEDERHQ